MSSMCSYHLVGEGVWVRVAGATYALWGMSARGLRGHSSHAVCASRSGAYARERGRDALEWLPSV